MKKLKATLFTFILGISTLGLSNPLNAEAALGPIKPKCVQKGTPHISKRNNILVCMLNHTRCCFVEIIGSNGMSSFLVELDNGETFEFESYTYAGTDNEGNVTFHFN